MLHVYIAMNYKLVYTLEEYSEKNRNTFKMLYNFFEKIKNKLKHLIRD